MSLPSGFIEMARNLLDKEADDFIEAMGMPPGVSVRLNSRKQGASFPNMRQVKWCNTGFYIPERPIFTLDPMLHAGAYYVQDASSMIYYEVTKRILDLLKPGVAHVPVTLLDLCAAPGGKTTAMIDALPDGSRVVANEYVAKRAGILHENLAKWGYPNITVTNRDSGFFPKHGNMFDVVAVDAPCSGEGMMRKDRDALTQWSMELVDKCARLQREILSNAVKAVKPGGFLIYSTCTFNRYENEDNASFIAMDLGLEPTDLKFPEEWGIPRGINTDIPVWRFMPHKTEGEGLFLAVFRKPGEWSEPSLSALSTVTRTSIKATSSPTINASHRPKRTSTNNRNQKNFAEYNHSTVNSVPPIEEILSVDFDRSCLPEAEFSLTQALAYLRRESVTLPADIPNGHVIVTYKGLPLGPVKNIGSRANNLYPKQWRILMR